MTPTTAFLFLFGPPVVDNDGDGFPAAADCDDTDPAIHPGAVEIGCDGVDNDCDAGTLDQPDADGDGFSACLDCDDSEPDDFPGNIEVCDGVDNDCDALTDDGIVFSAFFLDGDGDGFGDPLLAPIVTCDGPPAGFVSDDTDCDDTDAAIHPGLCLTLAPGPAVQGAILEIVVGGADPGETVGVLRSHGLGGSCPPQLGGVCLALGNPTRFGSAVADGAGVAVVSGLVPAGVPSQSSQWFQAVAVRSGLDSEQSPPVEIGVP